MATASERTPRSSPGPLGRLLARLRPRSGPAEGDELPVDRAATDGTGHPPRPARADRPYVAGGARGEQVLTGVAQVLLRAHDDVDQYFGDEIKGRMLNDPAVAAAINYLAYGLIEHPLEVVPANQLEPGTEEGADPEMIARAEEAREAAAFCRRLLADMDEPIESVVQQMSTFTHFGCECAEMDWKLVEDDDGQVRLMLQAIRPLDRSTWQFVVDPFLRVIGILGLTPDGWGEHVLPPDKFCWLTWWPRGCDPRGRSIARPAFQPWFDKVRLWPELRKALARFGSPFLVGKTSSTQTTATVPVVGRPDLPEVSPAEQLLAQLIKAANGVAIAVDHDADVSVHEAVHTGMALERGWNLYDRQIVLSILNSVRAILEAQHGSRADSMTARDVTMVIVQVLRRVVCRMIAWQVLWRGLAWNFGVEYADRNCPDCSIGQAGSGEWAKEVTAMVEAGWSADPETHYPAIDARLGFRPRDPAKIREEKEAEREMARAAASARTGGNGNGNGEKEGQDEDEDEED